jgi:hypothetical protein
MHAKGSQAPKDCPTYEIVAGGIIAKLPLSWRDFATTLKHKRTHMSISDLIASLDIEVKGWARAKQSKGVEGQTSATMVHQPHSCGKSKCKQNRNNNKPTQSTTSNKKIIGQRIEVLKS